MRWTNKNTRRQANPKLAANRVQQNFDFDHDDGKRRCQNRDGFSSLVISAHLSRYSSGPVHGPPTIPRLNSTFAQRTSTLESQRH
jgi:hypothetical protein